MLTARDEGKGSRAVEELQRSGLPDVIFHQLDVADRSSIARLAEFVKTKFGKLDILVSTEYAQVSFLAQQLQANRYTHGLGSSGEQCSHWWNNHRS